MRTFFVVLFLTVSVYAADPIRLVVDATDAPRDVLHARLTVPATAGTMTFHYPKWLPGEHGPTGPFVQVAGMTFAAGGQSLAWTRDPRDMFVVRADVPRGANSVEIRLDYLDPVGTGQFTAGGGMTPRLALVSWNTLLLYPASKRGEDVMIEPVLRLPSGWNYATALETASKNGDEVRFEPVSMTRLIDSPVLIGAHFKKVDIPSRTSPYRHTIDIAADSASALETPATFAADYGRLVDETRALFGSEHFRHYDWLVTLSDNTAHFGLEHHESSDNRREERTLEKEDSRRGLAGLLSHEYVHSWNGKFRRPASLAVSNFDVPVTTELLWVYEGLTSYLGDLLALRSGLWTPEYYREDLALTATDLANRAGRAWRPLEDTAVAAQQLFGSPTAWRSYRRGVDFYAESILLWLDADMTIRRLTNGQRSLDDFCRRFYGGSDGDPVVKPYTFDDIVRTMNEVAAHDWAAFFNERLRSTKSAPMGGIEGSGWRLIYNDTPNQAQKSDEDRRESRDFSNSIGVWLDKEGRVTDVIPGFPAAKAGVVPGARILGVNGRKYTADVIRDAIRDSSKTTAPLQIVYEVGEFVNSVNVDYHGGLRYPHLERVGGRADLLVELGKPLANR